MQRCENEKVEWWEVLDTNTHVFLQESLCIDNFADNIYYVKQGLKHDPNKILGATTKWDLSLLNMSQIQGLVANKNELALLKIYNQHQFGEHLCCDTKDIFKTFQAIVNDFNNNNK